MTPSSFPRSGASKQPRAIHTAQRVVLVVAYGLALWMLWQWIEVEGWEQLLGDGGSMNYTLGSGVVLNGAIEMRTNVGLRLWVQLGMVLVWLIPSLWVLRSAGDDAGSSGLG